MLWTSMGSPSRQKLAVAVVAVVALGLIGVSTVRDRAMDTTPDPPRGTVTATPTKKVDVVDLRTSAQAAIAVSNRLFASADVAVLTDAESRADAIAAATRLKVPVLLEDPAAPAELTRLRATRVLTFGTVSNVVGALVAATDPDALDAQLAELPRAAGKPTDAVVLMKSATTFDVAAASAKIAGATVLQSTQGDLRKDATTAAALAKRPTTPVITLGAPFTSTFTYSLSAVQNKATQIGGGYFALPGRRFVGLHGKIGDPASGMLGQQNTQASIKIITRAASRFAANDSQPIVPTFEIVATTATAQAGKDKNNSTEAPASDLLPVVDAAEKAGVHVLIDLQPGSSTFLAQAKQYATLLQRKNVGLTLEPAFRVEAGADPTAGKGGVTAAEINEVATWLADLTDTKNLPQKLLIVREPSTSTVSDRQSIDTSRPELSVVLGVDVSGDPATKLAAWRASRKGAPRGAAFGWLQDKRGDQPMFTVNQTYKRIDPYPSVVMYQ